MTPDINDQAMPIKFPNLTETAYISKDVKVIELLNKTVQVTYSLN